MALVNQTKIKNKKYRSEKQWFRGAYSRYKNSKHIPPILYFDIGFNPHL